MHEASSPAMQPPGSAERTGNMNSGHLAVDLQISDRDLLQNREVIKIEIHMRCVCRFFFHFLFVLLPPRDFCFCSKAQGTENECLGDVEIG